MKIDPVSRVDGATAQSGREILAAGIAACLLAIRARRPRIHAITSPVALALTANGLLALGATPSLTANPEEIEAFVSSSDGLLVNLGMMDPDRFKSAPLAASVARRQGIPFVLDPVFADRSPERRRLALTLLAEEPGIVKLNEAEATAFRSIVPATSAELVTGARDRVKLGERAITLANGHALMGSVTATGCLLGAIIAACHAVEADAFRAAIAGVSILNIAAECAATRAEGPGTFAPALLDALSSVSPGDIHLHLKPEFAP